MTSSVGARDRPNPVGRAKHDAWASVSGLSSEQANGDYVQAVAELREPSR